VTIHVSPEACPALVLNADFRPLSYYPLSLWSWQDAIKAVCLDRVNIVSLYDTVIHSPSFEMRLPSVVPPLPASTCSCAIASSASIAAAPTI